jgi:hypothetical protein
LELHGWPPVYVKLQYWAPCRQAAELVLFVQALAGGDEHPVPVNPQPGVAVQLDELVLFAEHVIAEGSVHAVPVNWQPDVCVHAVSFVPLGEQTVLAGGLQGVDVEYVQ